MSARRPHTLGLLLCVGLLSGSPSSTDGSALAPVEAGPPGLVRSDPDGDIEDVLARFAPYHTGLARFELDALAETIVHESHAQGISPSLVLGVIQIESGFYNFAVSHRGAMGLMQIMPATGEALARELGIPWEGPQTLFDPQVNVRMGIAYLGRLQRLYGHLSTALAAYNWGPGHISHRLRTGRPLPRVYARNVIDAYGDHAAGLAASDSAATSGAPSATRAATKPSTAAMAASSPDR